jgi:hypothetical protein
MIPATLLKALETVCQNIQRLTGKLLQTPLDTAQLANLDKRLAEFLKQIQGV